MSVRHVIDLLIVDDDHEFLETLVRRFAKDQFHVVTATSAAAALEHCNRRQFDVALVDMVMPGQSGLELLEHLRTTHSDCEVILLTGQGTIESAVQAMRLGAYDYLTKPFPLAELEALIEKAWEHGRLRRQNKTLKSVLARAVPDHNMIGDSPAMREVFRLIDRAGPTDKAILIEGESGTGKELVARALHRHSTRAEQPIVVINCAALSETLLESELFGHEKGAFTGATSAKQGLFELADGGTLFIDEIGELAGGLQAKLLRVLEDGSMRRVGSVKERRVDVRLLAATNRDMQREVQEGRFREDLYYRINVMALRLPPLRERNGDVRLLVDHFVGSKWSIEDDALDLLQRYHWPGNIRQLINAIDRAKILADDHTICRHDLPAEVIQAEPPRATGVSLGTEDLASLQRGHVIDMMRRERGNKARAARALGINRRSLYRLLDKYEIRDEEFESPRDTN